MKPLIAIESKIAQNFEIFLRSINMGNDILVQAIREMDVKLITLDMVIKFLEFIPSEKELVKLEPFKTKIDVSIKY